MYLLITTGFFLTSLPRAEWTFTTVKVPTAGEEHQRSPPRAGAGLATLCRCPQACYAHTEIPHRAAIPLDISLT